MTKLVGILNITPDSFSDGGQNDSAEIAVKRAEEMFNEGASIVDVGAESTRPGAEAIGWREETARLAGFMACAESSDWSISLDTYHPETIRWASRRLSSFIINDVTGFRDGAMRRAAAVTGNKVVVSHLPKASLSIQDAHRRKPVASVGQVVEELRRAVGRLTEAGVDPDKIIVDPGIGFGKSPELNWELLRFGLYMPGYEVMVGYSRKKFLGEDRMDIETNRLAGKIAIEAGAGYLRVHDVEGHASLI
ncbi:MAG: dihydropteroate synthase [Chloroflexi bacterium]|nr:dihydropteroate synthase [Chloroflexota bacterium]